LNNAGLKGEFPEGFNSFSELAALDVSGNALEGTFPAAQLTKLTKLKHMNVSKNRLNGSPDALASFPELTALDVSGNAFEGTLPAQLAILTKLIELNVNNNFLKGNLPDGVLLFLSKMTRLSLHNNKFTGTISSDVSTHPALKQM
jgi:Leucine-rich repeat (LRR) protein